MKKVLSALFSLILCFSLIACAQPETTSQLSVDIFIYDYADPYISRVQSLLEQKLSAMDTISAQFHDGAKDQTLQSQQIAEAVERGTDLLVVNIVSTGSEEAAMGIIDAAQQSGIPIIFFNREVSSALVNSYENCAFVGTDPDEAGYLQGKLIFDILSNDYDAYDLNGDGAISYIMFKGELANAEANGRTLYSVQEANALLTNAGYEELRYYDEESPDLFHGCDWEASLSKPVMADALEAFPFSGRQPIELVIANNDNMALGAIEALNEIGYNTGEPDAPFIPVVGVDALREAVEMIDAGKMSGTIEQDADGMASALVFLISNVADGNHVMLNTESQFHVDSDVAKIRIPYKIYA